MQYVTLEKILNPYTIKAIEALEGCKLEEISKRIEAVYEQATPEEKTPVEKWLEECPSLMKVEDVQEYLRIGKNAVYDFLNHPKCPTLRFGSSIRIRKQKLVEFIDDLENGRV